MSHTVDPADVPRRTLPSGARMPAIGFGTFGSDHACPEEVADAVRGAAEVGYRHFDCAAVYGNETRDRGRARARSGGAGSPREELWITSKLWNDKHGEDDVVPACRQSLADLRPRLPGPVPGPLALPQLPSPGVRRRLAQPRCPALPCTRAT